MLWQRTYGRQSRAPISSDQSTVGTNTNVLYVLSTIEYNDLATLFLTRDRDAGPEWCKYLFHIKPVNSTNRKQNNEGKLIGIR